MRKSATIRNSCFSGCRCGVLNASFPARYYIGFMYKAQDGYKIDRIKQSFSFVASCTKIHTRLYQPKRNSRWAVLKHKIFRAVRFLSISDKTEIEKGNWMLYNLIDRLERTNQLPMRVETLNLWLRIRGVLAAFIKYERGDIL